MNQGPEQLLQISNRHHVGPIRWRVVGVFMRLDEHRRTTDCNGGAGKHRHEAAFANTAGALAAGLLDRMGGIEHYRIAGFRLEDRKGVVSGKSVYVRGDLGGRGIYKNKTTYEQHKIKIQ